MNTKRLLSSVIAVIMALTAHCTGFTVNNLSFTILDAVARTVELDNVDRPDDTELNIPETVEDDGVTYTVTSVNIALTSRHENLAKITVPKTVEKIARLSGPELQSVFFTEGSRLKTIDRGAFRNTISLTKITLPESVEYIGEFAFEGCSQLEYIDIPENIDTIRVGTFAECRSLTGIKLPAKLKVIEWKAFYSSFGNYGSERVITLPEDLEFIGGMAFSHAEIHPTGAIPPTLAPDAFSHDVTVFVDDIALIDTYANADGWKDYANGPKIYDGDFTYCAKSYSEAELIGISNGKKSITIPETVNCGAYQLNVTSIRDYVFGPDGQTLPGVEEIYIKARVSTIGNQSFCRSRNLDIESYLRHIELPSSLQRIESETFQFCTQLKSIDIPDNVEYIGKEAFKGSGIETFTAPVKLTEISGFVCYSCSSLKTVTLHGNVKHIGSEAFANCPELKELPLPDGLESIYISAVGWNTAVTNLRIPHRIRDIYHDNSLSAAIPNLRNIFIAGGGNDTYFDIDGVLFRKIRGTDHHELMYYPNNRDEAEYTVPDGTTAILARAFGRYEKAPDARTTPLKRVCLPECLERIEQEAFIYNYSLENVNLPNGLKRIEDGAFRHDNALEVRIPETVTYIGAKAFTVNTMVLDGLRPPSSNPYYTSPFDISSICVRSEAADVYRNNSIWGQYRVLCDVHEADGMIYAARDPYGAELAGYVKMPEGILDIPQTVTIDGMQRNVTAIGAGALRYGMFTTVRIPKTVESVGSSCFSSCDNLTSAHIGDAKVEMSNFTSCGNLTEISANANNVWHTVQNGVLYNKAMDTLQAYPVASECETFVLPETVRVIGNDVLSAKTQHLRLKHLYSLSPTVVTADQSCFHTMTYADATLHVPANLVEEYIADYNWIYFRHIVGMTDDEIRDMLTGIDNIKADSRTKPTDGVFHTVGGMRTTKPGKGLYIRNGKKIIVR